MQFYAVALGSPKQAIKPQPSLVPRPLPPSGRGLGTMLALTLEMVQGPRFEFHGVCS